MYIFPFYFLTEISQGVIFFFFFFVVFQRYSLTANKSLWMLLMLQPGQCSGWLSGGSSCCLSPSLAAVAPSSLPGLLPSSCTQLVLVQRKTNHTLVFSSCFLGQIILWLLLLHCLLNNSDICLVIQYHWLCCYHLSTVSKCIFVTTGENTLIFAVTVWGPGGIWQVHHVSSSYDHTSDHWAASGPGSITDFPAPAGKSQNLVCSFIIFRGSDGSCTGLVNLVESVLK